MDKLAKLRTDIDRIDRQIADLLDQRFDVVMKIKEVKSSENINVYDPNREKRVLERLSDNDYPKQIREVYQTILRESKNLQKSKPILGLIGGNISYSYSPEIHSIFLYKHGIDSKYQIFDLEKNQLENFFKELRKSRGCCNVTVPYKLECRNYLDESIGISKNIGVNSIKYQDGKLVGMNTDILGFKAMLDFHNIDYKNKSITILGNGATSKMVVEAIGEEVSEVVVVSLEPKDNEIGYDQIIGSSILINTTPVGTGLLIDQLPIKVDEISYFDTLIDLAYNPFFTKLLVEGRKQNKEVYNSLYMLVSQAIYAQEFFNNIPYEKELVDKIYQRLHHMKTNIVFIGMPGSGKTTFGKSVSELLGVPFIDVDAEIIHESKMTIEQIFADSDKDFRKLEKEMIAKLSNNKNSIISTGGGVILDDENMSELMSQSFVIYLNRSSEKIKEDLCLASRPLLSNFSDWDNLLKERESLYIKYADLIIDNNESEEAINEIKRIWRR